MDSIQEKLKYYSLIGLVLAFCIPSIVWGRVHADPEAQPEPVVIENVSDPYEKINRAIFKFNDKIDVLFLKPIATLYNKIIPTSLNKGIANFFSNIELLPTVINDVLQVNFRQTLNDVWRLGINTTIGIGGLFDVATHMQLKVHHTDFGLTLAKWGYRNSSYIVLPFWGPSTIRDTMGMPVDYFAFSVYPHIHSLSLRYGIYGLGVVSRRARLLTYQDVLDVVEFDKYVFARNAYMQRRIYQITQTKVGYQNNGDDQADASQGSQMGPRESIMSSTPYSATSSSHQLSH